MLSLYITGYGVRKKLCASAVEWFICKYLPRHHITIEVLHRGLSRENALGFCDIDGRTYRPRTFLIELQPRLPKDDYIRILLHELWHVYQFVKGDLRVKCTKPYYKGQCIEGIDYKDLEHEKEAYKMESILYEEYIRYLNV